MSERHDLADPDFEPSDEELTGISARAFAAVKREHEQSLERLRLQILAEKDRILRALAKRAGERKAP